MVDCLDVDAMVDAAVSLWSVRDGPMTRLKLVASLLSPGRAECLGHAVVAADRTLVAAPSSACSMS